MTARIDPLTSVRFFAALSVVFFHEAPKLEASIGSGFLYRFLSLGYTGVSFFFFLSGFVLALAYFRDQSEMDVVRFFKSRFARIYPLLFVCLLLDAPHTLMNDRLTGQLTGLHLLQEVLVSFAALEAWLPHAKAFDGPSWSISVELFFYLLFPVFAPFFWKLNRRKAMLAGIASYLGGALVVAYFIHAGTDGLTANLFPPGHIFIFVLGILLAKVYAARDRYPFWAVAVEKYAGFILLGCVSAYLCVPYFNLAIPKVAITHGFFVPLYALVILALASRNKLVEHLFSARWLVVLGEASFALYLLYQPMGHLMGRWTDPLGLPGTCIYVSVCIGLSVASFYLLETPSRRWIMAYPLREMLGNRLRFRPLRAIPTRQEPISLVTRQHPM